MPEAELQLQADLRIEGDRLAGHVTLNRVAPRVEPIVAKEFGGKIVEDRLAEALQSTNNIQLRVAVGGTTSQPTYRLQTDLGERLAAAFKQVARAELEKRQNELAERFNRFNREVEQYLAEFRRVVAEQQKQLAQQLSLNEKEVTRLTNLVSDRIGVGKNLDIGKLGLDEFLR